MNDHIALLRRVHLSNLDMLAMLRAREAKAEVIALAQRIVVTSRERLDAAMQQQREADDRGATL